MKLPKMAVPKLASPFLVWAGFIALLSWVPWHLATNPDLPNSAAILGYNIKAAYLLVVGWALLCFGILATFSRPAPPLPQPVPDQAKNYQSGPSLARRWTERICVAGFTLIAYWPPAIARFGKHIEDAYFLTALQRMSCGEMPYVDFEFLYGPLMIAPAHAWMDTFGFSMTAYYAYYAMLQVALFVLIIALLQRFIPQTRRRWLAFFILLPFYVDILYGLNWIGWRHIVGLLAIVVISNNDRYYGRAALTGIILGLGAAFSYEYAFAAWCAATAILGVQMLAPKRRAIPHLLGAALLMTTVMLAIGLGVIYWATGAQLVEYIQATRHAAQTALSLGLGQFAFFWTGHSLALFFILSAVITVWAGAIRNIRHHTPNSTDLMLIGAVIFALVALKIGLQRADYLHMAVPFLPLIFVLSLGHQTEILTFGRRLKTAISIALVVASVTHLIGHAPLGRWVGSSMARGLYHEITARDLAGAVEARRHSIQSERSLHQPDKIELARVLAATDFRDRPVLYYYQEWDITLDAGTCASGYAFYDLLYSDARHPLAETAKKPGLIVVMNTSDYQKLFNGVTSDAPHRQEPALSKLARWTSSNHAAQSVLEQDAEWAMWKSALGDDLIREFHILKELKGFVLLERNKK